MLAAQNAVAQTRHGYKIDLKIDFDKFSYAGTERVRWVNRGEKPANVLYFHLYPNLRSGEQISTNGSAPAEIDEPRIEILEVRAGVDDAPLFTSLDDQGTTLRINLREPVAPGNTTEVFIRFKGTVPEIDRDETTLTTHVVKQVSADRKSTRLNSSHSQISYAVFCLKKKKIKYTD